MDMRFHQLALAPFLVLSLLVPTALGQSNSANLGVPVDLRNEVRDSFIFVFKKDVAAHEVKGRANTLARANGGRVTHVYTTALKGFAAKMPGHAAARMVSKNPNIAYYEQDEIAYAFKKPPWAGGGGGDEDECAPQETPWGIARVGGSQNGEGFTAWVIDSGIDLDHPDLDVDVGWSANFAHGKDSPEDGTGHGTHVAGTIAAINNECDVMGVAAGATVVAVRVLGNSGSGSYSGIIAGIDYVAENATPGDVANMSLGGPRSQAVNDAVESAASNERILFTLAAGNESDDADDYSPASANGLNIYTVSAIDDSDEFASFSNYGRSVDCAAPGVDVLSTKRGGGTYLCIK